MSTLQDASVIVARDAEGKVAILSSRTAPHGDVFLPGGRRDPAETPEDCARRELKEEAGVTAERWRHLGTYPLDPGNPSRISLFLAEDLTLGPQELTESEEDFKLSWWPMREALTAVSEGRFFLPSGPLALFLADRVVHP
ncbi:hypothetical protein ACE1SV_39810 [Streptomyces sp. E-15]